MPAERDILAAFLPLLQEEFHCQCVGYDDRDAYSRSPAYRHEVHVTIGNMWLTFSVVDPPRGVTGIDLKLTAIGPVEVAAGVG